MKRKETNFYRKSFKGTISRVVKPNAVIKFERVIYHKKYERFSRLTTKIKARISKELLNKVKVGDQVIINECRPLSKTIHHIITKIK